MPAWAHIASRQRIMYRLTVQQLAQLQPLLAVNVQEVAIPVMAHLHQYQMEHLQIIPIKDIIALPALLQDVLKHPLLLIGIQTLLHV